MAELLIYVLMGEHVVSYSFAMFRDWELGKYGKPNSAGIESARIESKLRFFEIFIDTIIFVIVALYILGGSNDDFHDAPLLNYWIAIDCVIMFLTLPYTYLSQGVLVQGEIVKNTFTLY